MNFPLKNYGGDLEAWARDVEMVLSDAHQADVRLVRERHAEPGCPKCSKQVQKGCAQCYWPKAVRYWRRLETSNKFAEEEGYVAAMKGKLAKVLE